MPGPCGPYKSKATGSSYTLNTNKTDFATAEQDCNKLGGHLAAWNTEMEQREVEGYFLSMVGGCRAQAHPQYVQAPVPAPVALTPAVCSCRVGLPDPTRPQRLLDRSDH